MRPERFVWLAALMLSANAFGALEEHACRLELESAPSIVAACSTLSVAENPAQPDGVQLELFVARVPALAAAAHPDPVVILAGGPGQSAVDLYLQLRAAFEPLRRNRDIVLLDQRGTGRSADGFQCATPADVDFQIAAADVLDELVRRCLAGLRRDPRYFTTSVAVGDLEQLREALEIEQWNLYGVSYGTRVAQHYLRRYPDAVRTLILDGVVPADQILGPDIAANAQTALERILERCAEDDTCHRRFGNTERKFATVLQRLSAVTTDAPVRIDSDPPQLSLQQLQGVVRLMSYSATTASLLPLTIDTAFEGRYANLLAQAEIFLGGLDTSLSFPMHNAVACSEDLAFIDSDTDYDDDGYLGRSVMDALLAICARWPVGLVDTDFKTPVRSDVPALLLSGGSDPATPPAYAQRAIDGGLGGAVQIVAVGQGHGLAAIGCMPRIMRTFVDAGGTQELDASCIRAEIAAPFFLSESGPAP